MTITATPSEISYAGDGVTLAFAIPFPFDSSSDITVIETDADGTPTELSSGYTISGGSGSTGTCTFSAAPASGVTITILDDPELTQPLDYEPNDAFPEESHEDGLDRVTRLVKRLHQRVGRSLRVRDGDLSSGDELLLPLEESRAGKFLAFDANGQPTASTGTGGGDSALRTDLASSAVGADGSLLVGYRSGLSGAIARTLHDKLAEQAMSLLDFGNVDRTGATSAVSAFNAAIAVAGAIGAKALFVPDGTYLLDSNIVINGLTNFRIFGTGPGTILKLSGNNRRGFRVDNCVNVEIDHFGCDGGKPSVGWETSNNFDFFARVGEATTATQNSKISIHHIWLKDIGLDGIYFTNTTLSSACNIYSENCRRWAVVVGRQGGDTFETSDILIDSIYGDCTNGTGPSGKEFPLGLVDVEPDSGTSYVRRIHLSRIFSKGGSVVMSSSAILESSVKDVYVDDSRVVLTNGVNIVGDIHLAGKSKIEIDGLADSVLTTASMGRIFFHDPQYDDGTSRAVVNKGQSLLPVDIPNESLNNTATGTGGAAVTRSRVADEVDGHPCLVEQYAGSALTSSRLMKHEYTGTLNEGDQVVICVEIDRTDANTPNGNYLYIEFGSIVRNMQPPVGVTRIMVAGTLDADVTNPQFNLGFSGTAGQAPTVRFRKAFLYVNPKQIEEAMFLAAPETVNLQVLTGSKTYDPASIADGAGDSTTVTVTGAALGDFVQVSFSNDLQGILLTGYVSAADTVTARFQNETGGAIDLASGTLRARVWKA
jgi:hypothetical protein